MKKFHDNARYSVSNNEPFTYSNFRLTQPENNNEQCVLNQLGSDYSSWDSISCGIHDLNYICEMKANSQFQF